LKAPGFLLRAFEESGNHPGTLYLRNFAMILTAHIQISASRHNKDDAASGTLPTDLAASSLWCLVAEMLARQVATGRAQPTSRIESDSVL